MDRLTTRPAACRLPSLSAAPPPYFSFFFFNDTATTEIYTLSLHDALPICAVPPESPRAPLRRSRKSPDVRPLRSEEHTSELQSRLHLVCRLLLEKKKKAVETTYSATQRTTRIACTSVDS